MLILALAGALAGATAMPVPGELCRTALAAVEGYHCVENARGVALAADPERARQLALYGQAAEVRFALHFGQEAAQYALIDWDGQRTVGTDQRSLNKAGFKRTLPWLSRAAYGEALRGATRQMVDAMAASAKLDDAAKAELLAKEMQTAERGLSQYEMDLFEATVVPHEIGHGLYTEAFWPGFVMDKLGHYGSPSPDWLDETAAILLESGDSAEQRRQSFHEAYTGRGDASILAELLDLKQFLTRDHPEKANNVAAGASAPDANGGPTITVVQNDLSAPRSGAMYYEQARMFADFLIERSGDRAVFAAVARAAASGQSVEDWLANSGDQHGLAGSLELLERDYLAWLAARFGAPRGPENASGAR